MNELTCVGARSPGLALPEDGAARLPGAEAGDARPAGASISVMPRRDHAATPDRGEGSWLGVAARRPGRSSPVPGATDTNSSTVCGSSGALGPRRGPLPPLPPRRPALVRNMESKGEAQLVGQLRAVVDLLPNRGEMAAWFEGPPPVQSPPSGASIETLGAVSRARRRLAAWQDNSSALSGEAIDLCAESFCQASRLGSRCEEVMDLLGTCLERMVGRCEDVDELLGRLQILKRRAHPDRYMRAFPGASERQGEVLSLATKMFQLVETLLRVSSSDTDLLRRILTRRDIVVVNNNALSQAGPISALWVGMGVQKAYDALVVILGRFRR